MRIFIVALISLVISVTPQPPASSSAGKFQVVVNAKNPETTLTGNLISELLLKKRSRWPNSDLDVKPVDLIPRSPVREALSQAIHGRSTRHIKQQWYRRIFSGDDTPPPEVKTDAAVIAYVHENPGGIGYVSTDTSEVPVGVKIVHVSESVRKWRRP